MSDRTRWAELIEVSKDKGPYKLAKFKADNHEFMSIIFDCYGIQGVAPKGSRALIVPVDGDLGKAIAFVMPPDKDRVDGQKEGDVRLKNHVKGQSIHLDDSGNVTVEASGRHQETIGGERTETIGGQYRLTTDGVIYVNC